MRFINQIGMEIKNILRSRFLLVMTIIVLVAGALGPTGTYIQMKRQESRQNGAIPISVRTDMGGKVAAIAVAAGGVSAGDGTNPIVVGDVSIPASNPLYWDINNLISERSNFGSGKGATFQNPETLDLIQGLYDELIAYDVDFAQNVTSYEDFRYELTWQGQDSVVDKFIYEHIDTAKPEALIEMGQYRKGLDEAAFKKKYIDVTAEQRAADYQKVLDMLDKLHTVVVNKDFPAYISLKTDQSNAQIADLQAQIAVQEQAIVDNPAQEESLNAIIEDLNKQIKNLQENTIPLLQLRLEKNIVPGDGSWQNTALTTIEGNRNQLMYTTLMTEEQFKQDVNNQQQYGTYAKYKKAIQAQINRLNNQILVAQRSVDTNKPDLTLVRQGARYVSISGLYYSVLVALFGVLLGGWLVASEFQQGTIRLLMIRPRTRIKILMGKFVAALVLSLALYVVGSIITLVLSGALFGFADFANPNYSVSGDLNFFAYYLPRLLVCMVTIVFGYTVAVMLSVVTRNTAVAVAVPIVLLVACIMASATLYDKAMQWLAYTPAPYVLLYQYFTVDNMYSYMQESGGAPLNVLIGIGWFSVLAVASFITSLIVFKKRDITN